MEIKAITSVNPWITECIRRTWRGEENITIRKSTENKSARISWNKDGTSLSIDFYSKGEYKSQVVVQHLKLPGSKKARGMKTFWGEKPDCLKKILEK